MHPIERRRPKVSIQDLRRDLREADEERYRLLVRTGDWRHPRVGVQEIRRQLREADEERFHLTMRIRSLVSAIQRAGIGACLFLVAGAAFAFWDRPAPKTSSPATTVETRHAQTAAVVTSPPFVPQSAARADQSGVRPRAIPARRSAGATPDRQVPVRRPESRPAVPRPLHPGEFGRQL